MYDLLNSDINKERNEGFTFYIQGDLNQMANQKIFLSGHGIDVKQNDVYPCIKKDDEKKALTLIWENRIPGWWHYKENYLNHSICTCEEFKAAF